ncbi:MAG: type II toxin-antitoxin system HicA family toxin, partial [Deltaproteobacteria bacterium]|nr:type II toxin-antitoxin system HicA family toxin [Deltaproteobacteria bacterium]
GVEEILNLQPKGSKAKSYQVKQLRKVILKHKLGGRKG